MSTFRMGVDLTGLKAKLQGYEERAIAATRPAAQEGAQVFYDQVKANVGRLKRKTGNLASSIYQAYSDNNSGTGYAVYHISWNRRKAPHGHLVEFGHLQRYEISFDPKTRRFTTHKDRPLKGGPRHIAARPFLRPAKDRAQEAKRAAIARFKAELFKRGGAA